ncbi:unnamed protein product [Rhodiola kirilowii]
MIRKRPTDRQQLSTLWQKCTSYRALKQIHATMVVKGFNSNPNALRELIFTSCHDHIWGNELCTPAV